MKKWPILSVLSILLLPNVFALGALDAFGPLGDLLLSIMTLVSLSWLEPSQYGIAAKFFLAITFFAILYFSMDKAKEKIKLFESKPLRVIVSISFSALSVIFMPEDMETLIGNQWGMAGAFIGLNLLTALGLWGAYSLIKNQVKHEITQKGLFVLWWLVGLGTILSTASIVGMEILDNNQATGVEAIVGYIAVFFQLGLFVSIAAAIITLFSGIATGDWSTAKRAGSKGKSWLGKMFNKIKNRGGGKKAREDQSALDRFTAQFDALKKDLERKEKESIKKLNNMHDKRIPDLKKSLNKNNSKKIEANKRELLKTFKAAVQAFSDVFEDMLTEFSELENLLKQEEIKDDNINAGLAKMKTLLDQRNDLRIKLGKIRDEVIAIEGMTADQLRNNTSIIDTIQEQTNKLELILKPIFTEMRKVLDTEEELAKADTKHKIEEDKAKNAEVLDAERLDDAENDETGIEEELNKTTKDIESLRESLNKPTLNKETRKRIAKELDTDAHTIKQIISKLKAIKKEPSKGKRQEPLKKLQELLTKEYADFGNIVQDISSNRLEKEKAQYINQVLANEKNGITKAREEILKLFQAHAENKIDESNTHIANAIEAYEKISTNRISKIVRKDASDKTIKTEINKLDEDIKNITNNFIKDLHNTAKDIHTQINKGKVEHKELLSQFEQIIAREESTFKQYIQYINAVITRAKSFAKSGNGNKEQLVQDINTAFEAIQKLENEAHRDKELIEGIRQQLRT